MESRQLRHERQGLFPGFSQVSGLVFLKEHNAIIIDLEMCGSDKVLHAFSIECMLDAFMEGKVFCYAERSEFLVAGDNTAVA
jgi:hypothetical protein